MCQEDPLSSYLFIIVVDVLSKGLFKVVKPSQLDGMRINDSFPILTNLFFSCDSLFSMKAIAHNVRNLRIILNKLCFIEVANFEKSMFYSKNTLYLYIQEIRGIL